MLPLEVLSSEAADRFSVWFEISEPAVLVTVPMTVAAMEPALEMVPRVLSTLPPTLRVASLSLVRVPSTLINSPRVVMSRLPACSVPWELSKRSSVALPALLAVSCVTTRMPRAALNTTR